jgi:hypothetical protein
MQRDESKEAGTQEIVTTVANCGKAFHKLVDLTVHRSFDAVRESIALTDAFSRFLWISNQFTVLNKEPCKIEAGRILLLLRSNSLGLILEKPMPKQWTAYSYRLEDIVKELSQAFAERGEVDAVLGIRQAAIATPQMTNQHKNGPSNSPHVNKTSSRNDRKTVRGRGEAQVLLNAALVAHHKYNVDGSINCWDPIGSVELGKPMQIGGSALTAFWKKWFESHAKYKTMVTKQSKLLFPILAQLAGDHAMNAAQLSHDTESPRSKLEED